MSPNKPGYVDTAPSGVNHNSVSVTVTGRFDATPEAIFDAWLSPEMVGRWMFGPEVRDEEVLHVQIDPRVGGAFSFVVRRDGEELDHTGTYLEIARPHRLAFTWGIAGDSVGESRVMIDIRPTQSGSELSLTHELDRRWADYADRTREGWTLMLDVLAKVIRPSEQKEQPFSDDEPGTLTGPDSIRFERLLPGPIERVWDYLVKSELRGKWLATGEMELSVGGRVVHHFKHADLSPVKEITPAKYREYEDTGFTARITACEPPRLLSYTWPESGGDDSEVTFELSTEGTAVQLILTHRRLHTPEDMVSVASGWHTHLAILADRLMGRESAPFWTVHAIHEGMYVELLARTFPVAQ